MSDPYDPVESDLRKQLAATRLALHHERSRVQAANIEIEVLTKKIEWLVKAQDLVIWDGSRWKLRKETPPQ